MTTFNSITKYCEHCGARLEEKMYGQTQNYGLGYIRDTTKTLFLCPRCDTPAGIPELDISAEDRACLENATAWHEYLQKHIAEHAVELAEEILREEADDDR